MKSKEAGEAIVLCLNSGSSSLKFALYEMGEGKEEELAVGAVEEIGSANALLWINRAEQQHPQHKASQHKRSQHKVSQQKDAPQQQLMRWQGFVEDHQQAVCLLIENLQKLTDRKPNIVGHRVVHGGPDYAQPLIITSTVLQTLKRLVDYAPLHMPAAILCIEAISKHFSSVPQVACFDTAFHRQMPVLAQRYPLPEKYWQQGIRRYGFHGLSYEYILQALGNSSNGRIIIAHLGNGASMAAINNGRPVDTTMGFTPAGGLMMGTRSGDIDPGVILHLLKQSNTKTESLDELLNHNSGLLGVSGISSDVKTLLDCRHENQAAQFALDLFCYQARKSIGALTAVLGGLDILVFTGGIGERSPLMRQWICDELQYLGIRLDSVRNETQQKVISVDSGECKVYVLPTNEDVVIARHAYQLLLTQRN